MPTGPKMRAKLTVDSVTLHGLCETVDFRASYSASAEDNTYAEATPSASVKFAIRNKSLLGQIKPGQKFYVDFTPIEE